MRSLGVFMVVVAALAPSTVEGRGPSIADYEIEVALDPDRHELTGTETIRWRNTTAVAATDLWFHLYLNAFASSESTFMRELSLDPMGSWGVRENGWGWTRITRLALPDGTDLLGDLQFVRPDDGNEDDFTVARVELPRAVLPGESIEVELDFEARLPRVVARTGYRGDFHMVAQWFPKLGVFEGATGWSCHQFHAATEFFADFGAYRVRLTVPRGWVVGATGELVSREPVATEDVLEFRAFDVHDFAWTAAPRELMAVVETEFDPGRDVPQAWLERAGRRLDLGASELELPPMSIRLLVPRSQLLLAPRMIRAIRLAVAWFGLHLGPYPEPQLTVVSPPPGAGAAGGMEYPTLFTTGASRLDAYPPFSWRMNIEAVTVHEFGHQYFQGIVASDEVESGWLDEGLTTWAEHRCLDDMIDDELVPEIRHGQTWAVSRLSLSFADLPLTIDRPTWRHRLLADAFLASYFKTALALRTLEGLVGEDRLLRAMRAYTERYRYRHPTGNDLEAVLEESTGEDLGWFFDAVVRGDATPDWAVLSVRHDRVEPPAGKVWRDGGWTDGDSRTTTNADSGERWIVIVDIGRLGDLQGPVEVALHWADGRTERRQWNGRDRWVRWQEESDVRLQAVVVDPDGVWALETRRADNYWRHEPRDPGLGWWLDGALRLLGVLSAPGS